VAVGLLEQVKRVATEMGIIVYDRERYLLLPELDCTVRLSPRTLRPVFRFRDSDYLVDMLCYYHSIAERYVCRALLRPVIYVLPVVPVKPPYEWQAVYTLIFEACYERERKDRGWSVKNNLHVECHSVFEFTSRDVNRYIRRKRKREIETFRFLLEYMYNIRLELERCCIHECYGAYFDNYVVLINLASESYAYYSSSRRSHTCYMDRCKGQYPREFPFKCEVKKK